MNKSLLLCLALIPFSASAQLTKSEIVQNKISRVKKVSVSVPAGDPYSNEIAYDRKGNDTAEYYSDQLYRRSVFEYTGNRVVKRIRYSKGGTEMDTGIYEYAADGGYKITTTDKQFGMKDYVWYNKAGNYSRIQSPDGSQLNYQYDAKGRLTSVSSKSSEGEVVANNSKYEYNAKGKLIKETRKGEFPYVTTYSYLPNGLPDKTVSVSKTDETKSTTTFSYVFLK